jgi:hypothetical protein
LPGYQKHLVPCRCILPQFKNTKNPPQHQFIVFSKLDDAANFILKFAQCNNCGLIHKVIDACRSEIMSGKEELRSILTISDIKKNLPENIIGVLESHDCSLPTWEHAEFIIENSLWGDFLPLTTDLIDGMRQGKYLRILGNNIHKIETFMNEEYFTP